MVSDIRRRIFLKPAHDILICFDGKAFVRFYTSIKLTIINDNIGYSPRGPSCARTIVVKRLNDIGSIIGHSNIIGKIPYVSMGIFSDDLMPIQGDIPPMQEVTRAYVLEVIEIGTKKFGGRGRKFGGISKFEKAAGLKPGSIKDIEKWPQGGTEIPRADRWQRMLLAAGIIDAEESPVTDIKFDSSMRKIGERFKTIESTLEEVLASNLRNSRNPEKD